MKRRSVMTGTRGVMSVQAMFSADEMKISNPEPHVHLVIKEFLKIGEAVAACWIQMPRGILLLQMVPGNPASRALYMYDRAHNQFYTRHLEGPDADLTPLQVQQLLWDDGLV